MARDRLLIAIEYMLGGGRIQMPSGHTLTMQDRELVLVARQYETVAHYTAGGEGREVLLGPSGFGNINFLIQELDKLPEEEFLSMNFGMALRGLREDRYGR